MTKRLVEEVGVLSAHLRSVRSINDPGKGVDAFAAGGAFPTTEPWNKGQKNDYTGHSQGEGDGYSTIPRR